MYLNCRYVIALLLSVLEKKGSVDCNMLSEFLSSNLVDELDRDSTFTFFLSGCLFDIGEVGDC